MIRAFLLLGLTWASLGAQVSYSPQPIPFGSVKLGATSATMSSTLTNTGPDTLRFCGPGPTFPTGCQGASSMTDKTNFLYVTDNCTTRPPGGTCVLQYRFAPKQVGILTGANVVQTNHGPFPLNFTGTGLDTVTVPPPPPPIVVASVAVQPVAIGGYPGSTFQLTAMARDASGAVLTVPIAWSSRNLLVATVDGAGLVTARAVGLDTVTATAQSRSGLSVVTVVPVPPPPPPPPPPVALAPGVFVSTLARFGISATPGTYGPWPIYATDTSTQPMGHFVVVVSVP